MTTFFCTILKIKGVQMKKKKEIKIKHRVTWGFSPVTRVKPSKKVYNRKKMLRENDY